MSCPAGTTLLTSLHPSTSHLQTYTSFFPYLHSDYNQSKCHTDLVSCIVSYFYVFLAGVRMVNEPPSGCTTENVMPCPNSWISPWSILSFLTKKIYPLLLNWTKSYNSLHDITTNFMIRAVLAARPLIASKRGLRLPRVNYVLAHGWTMRPSRPGTGATGESSLVKTHGGLNIIHGF